MDTQATGFYYLDDVPFTGVAFNTTKDGFEKSQFAYKDGLLSGRTTEWYAPTTPMVDSHYLNGVLHGRAREWHKNGQIAEDGEYEYGVVLWEKEWSEGGELTRDYSLKETDSQYKLLLANREKFGS